MEKILLVDDEPRVLSAVKRRLAKDYEVHMATSGMEGLDILQREGPFALVLSDYRMPHMDGVEFLQQVAEQSPFTSRVVLTGHASTDTAIRAINDSGVHAFLTKPCPTETLIEAIQEAIAGYQQEQDRLAEVEEVRAELHRVIATRDSLKSEMEKSARDTVECLIRTVEGKDPYTAGHQVRVAELCQAIACTLGVPEENQQALVLAAEIHDIGKLFIPSQILNKPTKLTKLEFDMIKSHVNQGYDLLKDIPLPWPLAHIIHQHHEREDGSGYPRGLVGDEISLDAKILAVADVVEAMISHRPYRPALGLDKALQEITEHAGSSLEPSVVRACVTVMEGRFQFSAENAVQ